MATRALAPRLRLPALAGAGALTLVALSPLGTDYPAQTQPILDALRYGDVADAVANQPPMGPLSLVLRWPAAFITGALGGDTLTVYRAGALACLLVVAWCVVFAAGRLAVLSHPSRGALAGFVAVLVFNPIVLRSLQQGHPEESVGAALCLVAMLFAVADRPRAAGIALGLAVANKQWALFAVLPVLFAAPRGRPAIQAVLGWAAAITAVAYVPLLAADPHAFFAALQRPIAGISEMRTGNLWHLVAARHTMQLGGGESVAVDTVPPWLQAGAHPGITLIALAVPAAWWSRHGRRATAREALALLALVLLVRCWLDPWNHGYYHLPALFTIAALEVVCCRRWPVVTAGAGALLWVFFTRVATPQSQPTVDLLYLAGALPLSGWLAAAAWSVAPAARIRAWTPIATQDPSPRASRSAA